MKFPYSLYTGIYQRPDQQIFYRVYRHSENQSGRRLVLLHGAGVAGEDTWQALLAQLGLWSEVLVPDLRGMGKTVSPDGEEYAYTAHEVVADVAGLLTHLNWQHFDLAGYSMGGLISMLYKQEYSQHVDKQYLLESAAVDRGDWQASLELRAEYMQAAKHLSSDTEKGVKQFLDAISPNRRVSPVVERLTVERLAQRPRGFANALKCVTDALHDIDREALVSAQGDVSSFIGGNSVDAMHQYQRALAERLPNWHYFMVTGTDHSLPFQKPRQIAQTMQAELGRYLAV